VDLDPSTRSPKGSRGWGGRSIRPRGTLGPHMPQTPLHWERLAQDLRGLRKDKEAAPIYKKPLARLREGRDRNRYIVCFENRHAKKSSYTNYFGRNNPSDSILFRSSRCAGSGRRVCTSSGLPEV
jgi:hypothetical protein